MKIPIFFLKYFSLSILFFLYVAVNSAEAAPIKILSDTRHAYNSITNTINLIVGSGHLGTDFIVDSTNMNTSGGTFVVNPDYALNVNNTYYNHLGSTVSSSAPYHLFTISATGYPGDSFSRYNTYIANDLAYNYAFSNNPVTPPTYRPPTFYISPGYAPAGSWGYGVEWCLNTSYFTPAAGSLSNTTAANAAVLATLRYYQPTWNWYDVKAVIRQNSDNWAAGYNHTDCGFGILNQAGYASASSTIAEDILLQPPAIYVNASSNRYRFYIYPFRQTRRVKEVLFKFDTNPGFHGDELSLSDIQSLGGVKITEYTENLAKENIVNSFDAFTDDYFVWLTADDMNDAVANFSRIDTYSVYGPYTQSETQFISSFDTNNVQCGGECTSSSTIFSWNEVEGKNGISKYQLYIDGVLNRDNITGTSTTMIADGLSAGNHSWYVVAVNGDGVSTSSVSVRSFRLVVNGDVNTNIYVDNVLGDDSNNGTSQSPLASLDAAVDIMVAGDSIVLVKNENNPYRVDRTMVLPDGSIDLVTVRGVDATQKPEIWSSKELNCSWTVFSGDIYRCTSAIAVSDYLAVGENYHSISLRTKGSAAGTLESGEWYVSGTTVYYRLQEGENINTLNFEIPLSVDILWGCHNVEVRNIVMRFTMSVAFSDTCGENNMTFDGVEVYDSLAAFSFTDAKDLEITNSILVNNDYGLYVYTSSGNLLSITNSTFAKNRVSDIYLYTDSSNADLHIKNNIFASNNIDGPINIDISEIPNFHFSNNSYLINGNANWDLYKGLNNLYLTNPLFINEGDYNFALQTGSPAINSGLINTERSYDAVGQPVYDNPDIGALEFQPPYMIGSHPIPKTGSHRLYQDGKYRTLTATTSMATTSLLAETDGGLTSSTSVLIDISIDVWPDNPVQYRSWSATGTTNTTFTISELSPEIYYEVTVDGVGVNEIEGDVCINSFCRADSDGVVEFTYTGSWSNHLFAIQGDIAPSLVINTLPENGAVKQSINPALNWSRSDATDNYKVYLGTDLNNLSLMSTQDEVGYNLSSLSKNTKYYWRVDSVNNSTTTRGSVWEFTTTNNSSSGGGGRSSREKKLNENIINQDLIKNNSNKEIELLKKIDELSKLIKDLKSKVEPSSPIVYNSSSIFNRDLEIGDVGDDVKLLQKNLNRLGFNLAQTGEGSLGYETDYFGVKTQIALQKFQCKNLNICNGDAISSGYGRFGPKTKEKLLLFFVNN